jgi:hypothetical protein
VHHQYLVYLIYTEMKMVRHQCVVENLRQLMGRRFAVHLDVLQILDEQNLDVIPPFLDAEHHLVNLVDVVVDAEPRHQLKMDYYLDEVDAEPRHQLKMDYYLDEELQELELQELKFQRHRLHGQPLVLPPRALQLPLYWQSLLLVQALTLQYRRQVRLQVRRLVQR